MTYLEMLNMLQVILLAAIAGGLWDCRRWLQSINRAAWHKVRPEEHR